MFKKIFERWKKIAHAIGRVQTFIIMTLVYFLVVPFFSLVRLRDPLRKSLEKRQSFWENRKPGDPSLERLHHLF